MSTIKSKRLGHIDITQVSDLYKSYTESLARHDLKGLSDLYSPNAVIIANKTLSRHTRGKSAGAKTDEFLEAYLSADIGTEHIWEYIQATDAFLVRSRATVRGVERDTFGYFYIRNGKIWRHVSGIEADGTRTSPAQIDPSKLHPVFTNLAQGLQSNNIDELMKNYSPNSVCLIAANKSWGFRARGAAEGRDETRSFLEAYMKAGGTMVQLTDYAQHGDTIYMHGLMSQNGVVTDSYGAFVLESAPSAHAAAASSSIAACFSMT